VPKKALHKARLFSLVGGALPWGQGKLSLLIRFPAKTASKHEVHGEHEEMR
jgi:hypothetical protein